MVIDVGPSHILIPLEKIVSKLAVRRLSPAGVKRIQKSMQRSGFLDNYPLIVADQGDGTYKLVDGNHRYEAAKAQGILMVPCVIRSESQADALYKLALQSNDAAEAVVPSTLVTHAEFIWQRSAEGKTQSEIAEMMGWSRGRISQYASLENIDKMVWDVIATTFENGGLSIDEEVVASSATTVAFTEGLLRSILSLNASQQMELVQSLAHPDEKKRITKGKFKTQAENYQARNEAYAYATQLMGNLGEEFTSRLAEEVYSGAYDDDWRKDPKHPKLQKLIVSLRNEWERKHSIHLIHGDFYEEARKLGAESVDLIVTDPPYNIARENEFELEGRSNISQNFGEWDKYEHQRFIALFDVWAQEWARLLRPQGSGYVFTSDGYVSHLIEALERAGLHFKATIIWHKKNPGTQIVKTNFKSSVEYLLFFTRGEGGHTFNWQGENEMHNWIETPICGGNERLTDAKGKILHPTQKPEQLLRHFIEISSNRGDMILDGFMGVGSTGAVAKRLGRKFIGIEQEKAFYDAAVRRLADE